MEKARGISRKMKGRPAGKTKPPSPITLLERLRDAVFRLIMICAFSKTAVHEGTGCRSDVQRFSVPNDHHHSEAVAECIEFIKKKAGSDDESRRSSASSSMDAETAIPVPVL